MVLIDNTEAELEAFETVCRRLGGFDERIHFEWADGYLTALAAGPRVVPIDEWLPKLAGDAFERSFADPDDAAAGRAALLARCRALASHLDPEALLDQPDALRLQPMVGTWDDEARAALTREHGVPAEEAAQLRTGAEWALGFLTALQDFQADWGAPADLLEGDAEAFDDLLSHVEALLGIAGEADFDAHLQRHWKDRLPTREDLLDEACLAVQDLRVWWLDHAPRPATRHVPAQPGRNDPCPCGSGKKFKKCHGRSA